jgi:ribosome-binding factor A
MMISRDMKDRRVGFVTVTGVQVSPDLRHARVFVSLMGSESERKESLNTLTRAAGWLRHELGQRIRMRFVPDLVFLTDTSQDYGEHIDQLINKIHEHSDE